MDCSGGGAERVFVELANDIAALGIHVDIVLAAASGPYLSEVSNQVRIIDLNVSRVLMALIPLRRYLLDRKPTVLMSGLDHANIVACLASWTAHRRCRCIVSLRSMPSALYRETKSAASWVIQKAAKFAYQFADGVIVNSRAAADEAARLLNIQNDKISVIYNPLNLTRIAELSAETPNSPWGQYDVPIILGVGRLDILKDFETLIRAFSIVRSRRACRLVILGEGPQRTNCERLIDELGIRGDSYLPGFVGNPFSWMRNAAVVVSSSRSEGCPNAVLQALACGTAVVSTNCYGGSAEVLEQGRWGRLVSVGSPEEMAEAIDLTLQEDGYPDGRKRAEDFSNKVIVPKFLEILLPGALSATRN